jgi:hypothetical protein
MVSLALRTAAQYVLTPAVALAADLPWMFQSLVCNSAPAKCKALLLGGGTGGDAEALPELLGKALEHAAALLHETAVNNTFVSDTLCPYLCSVPRVDYCHYPFVGLA